MPFIHLHHRTGPTGVFRSAEHKPEGAIRHLLRHGETRDKNEERESEPVVRSYLLGGRSTRK